MIFAKDDRLIDCFRYTFVFSGCRGRHPLPQNFIIHRRGGVPPPVFTYDNRSFSGAPRRSPTGCFVIFVNLFVFWTVEDGGPYNRFQNFIVGAIHESPVLTYDKCSFLRDVEDVIPYKKFYYSP